MRIIFRFGGIALLVAAIVIRPRPEPLASRLTGSELEAHRRLVAELGDKALWLRLPEFAAVTPDAVAQAASSR